MVTSTSAKGRPDPEMTEDSDEEPNFSDPEDFEDDINDEDLLEDLLQQRPSEAAGLESVIVVDNIPVVDAERFDKLKSVIQKMFKPYGEINSWEFPLSADGKTKGFVFIEYKNEKDARNAIQHEDGKRLDKNHTFAVCPFSDFQKYESMADDWRPPQPEPYVPQGNLKWFMLDPECRDQFALTYENGAKVSVNLFGNQEDTELMAREAFSDLPVMWSPRGTYLCTFHERGIILWGGKEWKRVGKFPHDHVRLIDFSPCEWYLVSFSEGGMGKADIPEEERRGSVIVWDVLTGQKRRTFTPSEEIMWPMFKWSHDDQYFARQSEDQIQIYETPSCGLLDKKSLKVSGVKAFSWCPTLNIMAYWVSENRNVPARVTLVEIPSRQELRSKNLFNVADCKMCWQKNGDYLAVKVDRYQKAKKEGNMMKYTGMYFNFEVFMIREKNIPVDMEELKASCVTQVAWEPNGSKFAVAHGEGSQAAVTLYQVKQANVTFLKRLEDKSNCNKLLWSPNGQFIVLAGLKSINGLLEFVDTVNDSSQKAEHFRCTDIEWDPTGRYVVTSVSAWAGDRHDNGYQIYNFQGKLIRKVSPPVFCAFMWRPRPRSLLTEEHMRELKKNFKKYSQQFEIKDRASMSKVSKDIKEKRERLMAEHRSWQAGKQAKFEASRLLRLELRKGVDTDTLDTNTDDLEEETLFVLVKEESVPVAA